ncbi:hypothetical protein [Moorena sp. SIO4A5]|uniref:hypothetical protein n=2 Tax=unclassified Moorena TaxID=2683338 RepID=UPI0013C8E61A|nr:hypothetical protein [Moorena sp. SIO4A5]NEO23469.1 hypothetical protein [Moorena sp. SIO4A5]
MRGAVTSINEKTPPGSVFGEFLEKVYSQMNNWLKQLWTTLVSFTINIRQRLQQLAATIVKGFEQANHSNSEPIDQQSSSQDSQQLSESSQIQIVMNYTPPNDGKGPVGDSKNGGSLWKLYQLIHENPEFSNPQLLPISASKQLQLSQLPMVNAFTPPNDGKGPVGDSKNGGSSFMSMNTLNNYNPPNDGKGPVGDSKDGGSSFMSMNTLNNYNPPNDGKGPVGDSKDGGSSFMSMNTLNNYNPPNDGKGPVGDSKDGGSSFRR